MSSVDTRVHTAEELLRMRDDGNRYELVQGELVRMSPAGSEHTTIALFIGSHLLQHVRKHRLGIVSGADGGYVITRNPDTVRSPDAGFVRAERVVNTTRYFPATPDLAVEVNSPDDRPREVAAKIREYLAAGTLAVVVVDPPTRTVRVHRLSGITEVTDILEVDDVVPGWKMPLTEIFA